MILQEVCTLKLTLNYVKKCRCSRKVGINFMNVGGLGTGAIHISESTTIFDLFTVNLLISPT